MKSQHTLAALLTATVALTATSAHAANFTPFVRAEATFTDSGYDFDNAPEGFEAGVAFTGGVFIAGKHEVSLTTGLTKWEGDEFGPVGVARISFESEQVPVLLNYRYHFTRSDKLTVYVGPTLGLIHETATGNVLQNVGPVAGLKPVGSYDDSAWKTAFGGSLGVSYALSESWELTAAAQVLRVEGKSYDGAGTTASTDYEASTRVGFSLGLNYTW
jgi:opacity protein-like surface antigen